MVFIRDYQDFDYEQVRFNLEQSGLFIPFWDSRERLFAKIKRDPDSVIVAEENNCAVGNVFTLNDGWCAFIFHLAIREDFRNRGVGELLLREAENKLKRKGVEAVAIFTEREPKDLLEFYKRQGYVSAGNYESLYKKL